MTRESEFPIGPENSDSKIGVLIAWRENKGRLGKRHLSRNFLHKVFRQPLHFHEDGQLIPGERLLREDVPLIVAVVSSGIGRSLRHEQSGGGDQKKANKPG